MRGRGRRRTVASARVLLAVLAPLASGCPEPATVCADGRLCPSGMVCDDGLDLCLFPEQLQLCAELPAFADCSYQTVWRGRCYDGICLPAGCGNGMLDNGEACDDGNVSGGDGCSADCRSDERCGNRIVDVAVREVCDDGGLLDHDGCDSTCAPEEPTWTRVVRDAAPAPRSSPVMAYDAGRGRVVLFGGIGGDDNIGLDDTWEWDGTGWIPGAPPRQGPGPVHRPLVYDAARGRVVMLGGYRGIGSSPDAWVWNGAAWTELLRPPAAVARTGHALAYDARRRAIVLFGGARRGQLLGDTWTWSGAGWNQAPADAGGPSPRSGHAMAYDPVRDRVVLVGGTDGARHEIFDTWEWDGRRWAPIELAGALPSPRTGHTLAFHAGSRRVVLFGGSHDDTRLGDTWTWNGQRWMAASPATVEMPPARAYHGMAYDAARDRIVVFGGFNPQVPGRKLGDTWEWDGRSWTRALPATAAPPPRATPAMVFDARRGRAVLVGGGDDRDEADGTWEHDGTRWSLVPAAGYTPRARTGHAVAYDAARGQVVLFGGFSWSAPVPALGDTWLWDGHTWSGVQSPGPPRRHRHAMAYDPARGRVVLFGGTDDRGDVLQDTWEWDGVQWTPMPLAGDPPAPGRHPTMAFDPMLGRVVLFGGTDDTLGTDRWAWDGAAWKRLSASGPTGQSRDVATVRDDARARFFLYGDISDDGYSDASFDRLWELDGDHWLPLVVRDEAPVARNPALVYDPLHHHVLLFGGNAGTLEETQIFDETWRLAYRRPDGPDESCRFGVDTDGDGRVGCEDPDCLGYCAPLCAPGALCPAQDPHCGDGVCNPDLETCRLCPGDCGACPPVCGDFHCDPGETVAACPGDCAGP